MKILLYKFKAIFLAAASKISPILYALKIMRILMRSSYSEPFDHFEVKPEWLSSGPDQLGSALEHVLEACYRTVFNNCGWLEIAVFRHVRLLQDISVLNAKLIFHCGRPRFNLEPLAAVMKCYTRS